MVRGLGKLRTRKDLQRNMKRAGCVGGGVGRSVMLKGRNTRCCCPKPVWCKDGATGKTRLVAASECGDAPVLTFEFKSFGANATIASKGAGDVIGLSITSDVLLTGLPLVEMFDVNNDKFYSNALATAGTAGLAAVRLKAGEDREYVATVSVAAAAAALPSGAPANGAATFRVTGATAKVGGKTAEALTGGGVTVAV